MRPFGAVEVSCAKEAVEKEERSKVGDGTMTSNAGLSELLVVAENTSAGLATLRCPSCPPKFPNRLPNVGEVGEGGFDLRLRLCNIFGVNVPFYGDISIGRVR